MPFATPRFGGNACSLHEGPVLGVRASIRSNRTDHDASLMHEHLRQFDFTYFNMLSNQAN